MLKKITVIIGFSLLIYSNASYAGMADIKQKLRPYVVKFLGEETATKLMGAELGLVEMPVIPKVNRSALDGAVFKVKRDEKEKNVSKKEKSKLDLYFVDELYTSTRNVRGNKDELGQWFNVLSQGGTREGVYRALVLDNTYRGLENFDNPASDSAVDFATYFFPRFLNKIIKKKMLSKLNFYTLKRLTTKNCLEVVDEYIKNNRDGLYSWYAVFSGELATKYPKVWKNKLRKTETMTHHKKWAATVPDQHIKSEVIIKINKVYNSLK